MRQPRRPFRSVTPFSIAIRPAFSMPARVCRASCSRRRHAPSFPSKHSRTRSAGVSTGIRSAEAASQLNRSDARILRQALEDYLEECEARERLRDPTDPVLDWDEVRRTLLDAD